MKLNTKEFKNAIKILVNFVSRNSSIIPLSCFCFDDNKIKASNGVQSAEIDFETDITGMVDADLLNKLINKIPTDEFNYSVKDDLEITFKRSKVELPLLDKSDFPTKQGEESLCSLELNDDFFKGLSRCSSIVSTKTNRPELLGVTLKVTDNNIVLYSTNNFIISKYKVSMESPFEMEDVEILLPINFCNQLLKIYESYKTDVRLYVYDSGVSCEFGSPVVFTASTSILTDITLLDFESILRKYENLQEVNKIPINEDLTDCIDRVSLISDNSVDQKVSISVNDSIIKMESKSFAGNIVEDLDVGITLDSKEFTVDPKFLLQSIKYTDNLVIGDEVLIFYGKNYTNLMSI